MGDTRHLYYLSDAEIPGRNARSIQEMQMCSAFAGHDIEVHHYNTASVGSVPDSSWADVQQFYDISNRFSQRTFPTLQNRVPQFPKVETLSMATPMAATIVGLVLAGRLGPNDIVYGRNYYPLYFVAKALRVLPESKRPTVVFEYHDTMNVWFKQRFFERLDGLVCITAVLEEHARETYGVTPETTLVAPDGVDLSRYPNTTSPAAREAVGIPADEQVVMYTGHLYPGKGADVLVDAAEHIDAAVYVVGGYPDDVDRIRSSAPPVDNVTFTGFVEPAAIPTYQRAADVLVAPYTEDARRFVSPLKLFEYMAAERPILSSDTRALNEVLEHGQNALLVTPGDAVELAKAIRRLLTDEALATRLAANGRRDVEQYTWSRRASTILQFVDSL